MIVIAVLFICLCAAGALGQTPNPSSQKVYDRVINTDDNTVEGVSTTVRNRTVVNSLMKLDMTSDEITKSHDKQYANQTRDCNGNPYVHMILTKKWGIVGEWMVAYKLTNGGIRLVKPSDFKWEYFSADESKEAVPYEKEGKIMVPKEWFQSHGDKNSCEMLEGTIKKRTPIFQSPIKNPFGKK